MTISFIVAMDKNRVIGKNNDLPWRLPKEWQYVKKTTMGHSIILGRKNFESIGKALPGRRNIILTRDISFSAQGCEVAHSVTEVFEMCRGEEEIFIFGGEEIYRLFLPYADKLYMTKIDHEFDGDTYFPEIDYTQWNEVSVEQGETDEANPYIYYFYVYTKKE
ncbi:dihydrofolate reductase [Paenibacillus qinlingensis]|uniref:Dihydrofolate reductase n=1 Tax=Paenibacillus qinlingensis TaxID=1837343 RepID=A0ABU1P678_9BACL|nr:dihydrofolate reductase [Paenibacillus qinlingensis]MDR6555264.1 dihydrofolate reductase [Paenibacillus qinlingensis]